jgi:hypothetical protein
MDPTLEQRLGGKTTLGNCQTPLLMDEALPVYPHTASDYGWWRTFQRMTAERIPYSISIEIILRRSKR